MESECHDGGDTERYDWVLELIGGELGIKDQIRLASTDDSRVIRLHVGRHTLEVFNRCNGYDLNNIGEKERVVARFIKRVQDLRALAP